MRTEDTLPRDSQGLRLPLGADGGVAKLGTFASSAALLSAAACCILPLGFAVLGIGSAGLSAIVPFHWPLTVAAVAAVAVGWLLYIGKRRACARNDSCATAPPARATLVLLCAASLFVTISALWGFIEAPLVRLLGGE